jgi:hypothetical protein
VVSACIAHDFDNRHFRERSGSCLQDNRAVGNSRLVHRDVSNVSCKQLPVLSPWHGVFRVKETARIIRDPGRCLLTNNPPLLEPQSGFYPDCARAIDNQPLASRCFRGYGPAVCETGAFVGHVVDEKDKVPFVVNHAPPQIQCRP